VRVADPNSAGEILRASIAQARIVSSEFVDDVAHIHALLPARDGGGAGGLSGWKTSM
jgi:hypothetical protein